MRTHHNPDEQVARLSGWTRGFALTGEAKHHAIIDTGRDLDFDLVRNEFQSAAAAVLARRFDQKATTGAARARRDRNEMHRFFRSRLLFLAAALAFRAGHRRGARLRAAACAGLAPVGA